MNIVITILPLALERTRILLSSCHTICQGFLTVTFEHEALAHVAPTIVMMICGYPN